MMEFADIFAYDLNTVIVAGPVVALALSRSQSPGSIMCRAACAHSIWRRRSGCKSAAFSR